jgi:hypothetical protein
MPKMFFMLSMTLDQWHVLIMGMGTKKSAFCGSPRIRTCSEFVT